MQWRKKETKHEHLKKEAPHESLKKREKKTKKLQKGTYVLYRMKNTHVDLSEKKMKGVSSNEGPFMIKSNNGGGRYDLATADGKGSFRIFI